MKRALFSLALGTFTLGIAEFMMMGILSVMAQDLAVSLPAAGHLISFYALGVCVGAPLLLFARRLQLRSLMIFFAAVIAAGNALAALSNGFRMLCVARFISGLPHGAYFGVGAIVARKLAPAGREVSAVSYMIAGMTVATVCGVPLGTFISTAVSWRMAFGIVAFSGLVTVAALVAWLPRLSKLPDMGFRGQFRFLRTLPPWLIFGGVLFGQIGLYCWYSYIDPQLLYVAGFPQKALSWLMVLAGLGMFIGNLTAGRLSDGRAPSLVAAWVQGAGMIVLLLFFFFSSVQIAAVVLMMLGTASLFGSGSPLQSSIVGYSRGGEMLGASCIQIAYNAGNAIAAWIGGRVIAAGYGYSATAIVGIPIVAVGCVLLAILYRKYERG